jgi:hypothetical protein
MLSMRSLCVTLCLAACSSSVGRIEQPVIAGAAGFAFLPPLAPQPTSLVGTFDASLKPTVEIRQVSADGLATFPVRPIGGKEAAAPSSPTR